VPAGGEVSHLSPIFLKLLDRRIGADGKEYTLPRRPAAVPPIVQPV
jgi:hypothetical protein